MRTLGIAAWTRGRRTPSRFTLAALVALAACRDEGVVTEVPRPRSPTPKRERPLIFVNDLGDCELRVELRGTTRYPLLGCHSGEYSCGCAHFDGLADELVAGPLEHPCGSVALRGGVAMVRDRCECGVWCQGIDLNGDYRPGRAGFTTEPAWIDARVWEAPFGWDVRLRSGEWKPRGHHLLAVAEVTMTCGNGSRLQFTVPQELLGDDDCMVWVPEWSVEDRAACDAIVEYEVSVTATGTCAHGEASPDGGASPR